MPGTATVQVRLVRPGDTTAYPYANREIRTVRAFIVFAIGALLIWVGLQQSGSSVAAQEQDAPESAEPREEDARGRPSQGAPKGPTEAAPKEEDKGVLMASMPPAESVGEADLKPAVDSSASARAASSREPANEARGSQGAPAAPYEARETSHEVRPQSAVKVQASPVEPSRASAPQSRPIENLVSPSQRVDGRSGRSSELTLSRVSAPAGSRVASVLLEAWIAREASQLETFLRVGDGADLPAARAQLVAGFWEAMVGSLDGAKERLEMIRGAEGVTSEEVALLEAAMAAPGGRVLVRPASASRAPRPLAHAMRMVLYEDEAQAFHSERHFRHAALAWSELISLELRAPWSPHRKAIMEWGLLLEEAQGSHRLSARGEWPFIEEKVRDGDALRSVRRQVLDRRPDLLICTGLIREVNDVAKYIQPGQVLRIPTDQPSAIVHLDARVLLYRHGEEIVRLWPIGIGKPGHETPKGAFTVGDKLEDPTDWSKLLPPGAPGNDLGSRWLGLYRKGQKTSYGIHGTTTPDSIGGAESLGCVRMLNEAVSELFELLPQGATVVIQD